MARILISHVPKDGGPARDLGSALMGRGHFVSFDGEPDSPRPDRLSRLRQFEAVVVVWTESSAASPGLAEIARETLPLNILISVRADDLDRTRLPLMFRKLNMFAPRDVDGISRLIARLNSAAASLRDMAERDAARSTDAGTSSGQTTAVPPQSTPDPRPSRAALPYPFSAESAEPVRETKREPVAPVVEPGGAVRARPLTGLPEVSSVQVSEPAATASSRVTSGDATPRNDPQQPAEALRRALKLNRAAALTADDLAQAINSGLLVFHIPDTLWLGAPATVEVTLGREVLAGLIQDASRQSIETLSLSLYGSADAFDIERQSERTQFVNAKQASRDPSTSGRWAWLVTPTSAGEWELVVRISALLRDDHGVPAPVAIPDRRFTVQIGLADGSGLAAVRAGWPRG